MADRPILASEKNKDRDSDDAPQRRSKDRRKGKGRDRTADKPAALVNPALMRGPRPKPKPVVEELPPEEVTAGAEEIAAETTPEDAPEATAEDAPATAAE